MAEKVPEPISWVGACPDCKHKGTYGLPEVRAKRVPERCPQCDSPDWEGDLVYPPEEPAQPLA